MKFYLKALLIWALLLQVFPAQASRYECQTLLTSQLKSEELQAESLSKSKQILKWNLFVTSRDLLEYKNMLHPDFAQQLASLNRGQVWLDLGGGRGKAVEEYLQSFQTLEAAPQAVLVTYKLGLFRRISDFQGHLQILKGRYWEEIPSNEIPRTHLMTDVFGVLSYTFDPTTSMRKIFDSLTLGGTLYVYMNHLVTRIHTKERTQSFDDFLRQIPGLRVEGRYGVLKITKLQQEIRFPQLKLIKLDHSMRPAFRTFMVVD